LVSSFFMSLVSLTATRSSAAKTPALFMASSYPESNETEWSDAIRMGPEKPTGLC
jgi:hypothetical protein